MRRRLESLVTLVRNVAIVARLRPFDTATAEGRSRERYRRIVLSAGASILGRVVGAAATLVMVPIAIAYLGKEQYGLWATLSSLAGWVALFDLGLVNGLVNAIAEANGRDDTAAASSYFSTAFFALCAVAGVLAVALAVALPVVPWDRALSAPPAIASPVVAASAAAAFGFVIVGLPLGLTAQVYTGYQKAYVSSAFVMVGSLLSLALLIAAVRARAALPAVVFASSCGGAAAGVANLAFLLTREMPWLLPSPRRVSRGALRRLLATSVPLYLFQVGAVLVNQSQQIVLAHRAGVARVAEYDLLWRIYVLGMGLITLTTSAFAPSFREAFERGELAWMRRSFWHLVRLRMAVALSGAAVLVVGGNVLLRTWLQRSDFEHATGTWALLAALLLAAAWASSFAELLTVLDRIWPQVALVLVQGVLTVAGTWFGAPYGVPGVLAAVALPAIAVSSWTLPWLARRMLGGSPGGQLPAPGGGA